MIPAGQRNQMVTLQRPVATRDELGQPIPGWVDVCSVWARARPKRGRDYISGTAEQSEGEVIFGINWRAGIDSSMRVLWRGVPYAIVAEPIDVDGGRHTLELVCASGREPVQGAAA